VLIDVDLDQAGWDGTGGQEAEGEEVGERVSERGGSCIE
jgi:hypothetical protein